MTTLDDIIANLHRQQTALLDDLRRLQAALAILDPPPEVAPKPADEQIKDGILRILQEHGPKTNWQLARALGISGSVANRVATAMVAGGALESRKHGKTAHYQIKRETLKIVAGEGVK